MNDHSILKRLSVINISCVLAATAFAAEPTPHETTTTVKPTYTLAFSDDFSTDPNTNGKWTVFRRQGNSALEGSWDSVEQSWYLTRQSMNLATAAFANYELTSTNWKANFKYRVDNQRNGADGFVFMFYKNKAAYGTPDSGSYMAFQIRNQNGDDRPVAGYGLQFDTYQYVDCDPILRQNYVAIIKDVVCNSALVYRPYSKIDDDAWHSVEFIFDNGHVSLMIDGQMVQGFPLQDADYTYTGIGFGAGTGSSVSNQIIDDFQIWLAQEK